MKRETTKSLLQFCAERVEITDQNPVLKPVLKIPNFPLSTVSVLPTPCRQFLPSFKTMHRNYLLPAIKELRDQQVRYVPRDKKIEQTRRAETLYQEIDPQKQYSYRFVCIGITDFRAEMHADLMLDGQKIKHDLILLIEDLFDSANVTEEEAGEKVWTIEDLSARFHVSGKTISRWRKQGLIARRFIFHKKKRVGFLDSSVRYFTEHEEARIKRGEHFSQLTREEKDVIIRTARRFANSSISPTEVAKNISRHLGRSVETIRYTLKSFDEQHADIPLFPHRNTPLSEAMKVKIYQEYRRGISIENLATAYHRTRGSIYRVVGQIRAKRIAEFALDYIDNPEFHDMTPEKEKMILGLPPTTSEKKTHSPVGHRPAKYRDAHDPPALQDDIPMFVEVEGAPIPETESKDPGLPPYLSGLYKIPLLTAEQEMHLFRKFNYLKYKASCLREKHSTVRPKANIMSQIEKLYDQIMATKNQIVSANLRLVVSIAKRHIGPYSNFFDLISDGNLSLLRAAEKFDYGRGNRFSTYATWAITRNFARTIPDEKRHRDRFHLGEDELLGMTIDQRSDLQQEEKFQFERQRQVSRLLHELDEREQKIIVSRFGIGNTQTPLTLNEVGVEMGVTKERVRQIEARALAKLRKVAEEENLEIPGL